MATGWDLSREYPDGYENWRYEVRNGDTLLGFRDWLGVNDAPGAIAALDSLYGKGELSKALWLKSRRALTDA